jgi:hypothetical protein
MLRIVASLLLVVVASAQLFPPTTTTTGRGPFTPEDPERRRHFREASPPQNVDLVIVGMTSGSHNPDVFITEETRTTEQWGEEGPSQLNDVGKREALIFGRALRERYGNNVVTERYFPTNYMAFSSTGEKEQMTCQVVNTGMFPPTQETMIDPSIRWQPIPVTTDDTLMGISRVIRCPSVRDVTDPIFNGELPVIRNLLNRQREMVDYIVTNTGIRRNNIEDLAQVAENLYELRVRRQPFPDWAEHPTVSGMDRETFYRRVQVFRNAPEVACSVYEPCKRLFSGVVLEQMKEIIETLVNTDRTTTTDRRNRLGMVVYTGDVEVILSILRILDLDYYNVPSSGGFILEIRTTNDGPTNPTTTPTVRVVYHERDTMNTERHRFYVAERVPGSGRRWDCPEDFCPVEDFLRRISPYVITDYRTACRDTQCTLVNPINPNKVRNMWNPVSSPKGVDCTYVTDKYPETACRELARNNFCTTNNFVRNVVCRRTCNCTQFDTVQEIN